MIQCGGDTKAHEDLQFPAGTEGTWKLLLPFTQQEKPEQTEKQQLFLEPSAN